MSVVIPMYGHGRYLPATLDSVFAQDPSFADYEVIVVDDGSPDDTEALLRPYLGAGRLRCVTQTHRGPAAARNRGVAEARGEFVALLDDDDLWPLGKLAWQVTTLRANPAAVLVYGDVLPFGVPTRGTSGPGCGSPCGRVRERFLERNWIASPGQTLIRSAAIRAVGGFDEQLWGADDWDLYLRLATSGEFEYVPRLALRYRVHGDNASSRVWRMYLNSCRVQRKHLGRFPQPGRLRQWLVCRRFILTYCVQRLALSLRANSPTEP